MPRELILITPPSILGNTYFDLQYVESVVFERVFIDQRDLPDNLHTLTNLRKVELRAVDYLFYRLPDVMEKFGRKDLECLVVHLTHYSTLCVDTLLDKNLTNYAKHVVIDLGEDYGQLYLHRSQAAHHS